MTEKPFAEFDPVEWPAGIATDGRNMRWIEISIYLAHHSVSLRVLRTKLIVVEAPRKGNGDG